MVSATVVFLHRGSSGVARGAMTPDRPAERSADGVVVNSPLRAPNPLRGAPLLAGALFAGYGRIDPEKLRAPEIATTR